MLGSLAMSIYKEIGKKNKERERKCVLQTAAHISNAYSVTLSHLTLLVTTFTYYTHKFIVV
jgi:hypothetical protein